MSKPRKRPPHNEWFRQISLKKCPSCGTRADVWSWGEYVRGNWRTVAHFCEHCFQTTVFGRLKAHLAKCGCSFNLICYGSGKLPDWLKLEEKNNEQCDAQSA